ncbi:protein of unknown function [Chryseobacterium sp. JV274]|nr:protein of unknown function [Chryseobacterium sp. JV274]
MIINNYISRIYTLILIIYLIHKDFEKVKLFESSYQDTDKKTWKIRAKKHCQRVYYFKIQAKKRTALKLLVLFSKINPQIQHKIQ